MRGSYNGPAQKTTAKTPTSRQVIERIMAAPRNAKPAGQHRAQD